MAVNKVVYNGSTLVDLTDTTAQADDVKAGKVFYSASGERSVGSAMPLGNRRAKGHR